MKEVYVISVSRTPIGSMGGSLSSLTAPQLVAVAIKSCIQKSGIKPELVQEVFMGNVLPANMGQAPAKQATLYAGLSNSTPSTTINKVCASGMKAIMIGAQSIMVGLNDVVIAGGMESMSNVPYYLDKARTGYRLGHAKVTDGIIKDGLWDVYKDFHMGNAAELCAKEMKISRQMQDEFAIESYKRTFEAYKNNYFSEEIAPVEIPGKGKEPIIVKTDEEYTKVNFDKITQLKPAFDKEGTITPANASKINDGGAAVLLMSREKAESMGIKPISKILGFGDAAQAPEWFSTSPSLAIPKALKYSGLQQKDVDYYEINEAFAVVSCANNILLKLDPARVNILGGAIALGHPIGCSGARIVATLHTVLKLRDAKIGVASICNGGGGASAIVFERM